MRLTRDRRYAGAGAVALAGLLLVIAAALRWLPCLAGDDTVCAARQTHAFDYLLPLRPHQPFPAAAIPAALALVLIAAAQLSLIGRRRIPRWLTALTLAVLMIKPLVFALVVAFAPLAGGIPRPVVWLLVIEIVGDLAIVVLLLVTPNDHREDFQRLLLLSVAVCASGWVGRVIDEVIFSVWAPEAAVPPGSGLLVGLAVLACGVGIGAIARAEDRR